MVTGSVLQQETLGEEIRKVLTIAIPVVLAELGWMGMGIVDTIMVGQLGARAIAAVALGNILFYSVAICGMSVLLGMDTLVSQAFGAGERDDTRKSLWHGLVLAALLLPLVTGIILVLVGAMDFVDVNREVLTDARPYVRLLLLGLAPLFVYAALRRYLQGLGVVRPVMFALVSANIVNVGLNWVFIYGHLGVPAMGIEGSAIATFVSRVYMALVLVAAVLLLESPKAQGEGRWRIFLPELRRYDPARLRQLLALGLPAAGQVSLEVGVFALVTVLAAKFSTVTLAAHEIVLNTVSNTFMVPLGVSAAASVTVGHAIGRNDKEEARRVGFICLALGGGFMSLAALSFYVVPERILGIYTRDLDVIRAGLPILFVCAWFQLFDGLQSVATGALRGLGDTRTPMLVNLVGYWMLGLPIACILAFPLRWGVVGLWIGLSIGLILVGSSLLWFWHRRSRVH